VSTGVVALITALGVVVALACIGAVWAFVDNRWFYKGRIPPKSEAGGWSVPDPHPDTKWWGGY
jgi:hypothetical protein